MTQPNTDPMECLNAARKEISDIHSELRLIYGLRNSLKTYLDATRNGPQKVISDVEKTVGTCEQIEKEYEFRTAELHLQVEAIENKLAEIVTDPGSDFGSLSTWAALLNGSEYPLAPSSEYENRMKAEGIVIFYGNSDDLLEARGAMRDEWGAWDGTTLYFENGIVSAIWTDTREMAKAPWIVLSSVPCQQFEIREEGTIQSIGVVLFLKDLGRFKGVAE